MSRAGTEAVGATISALPSTLLAYKAHLTWLEIKFLTSNFGVGGWFRKIWMSYPNFKSLIIVTGPLGMSLIKTGGKKASNFVNYYVSAFIGAGGIMFLGCPSVRPTLRDSVTKVQILRQSFFRSSFVENPVRYGLHMG